MKVDFKKTPKTYDFSLERKISEMENKAWALKSIIHKKNLELKW